MDDEYDDYSPHPVGCSCDLCAGYDPLDEEEGSEEFCKAIILPGRRIQHWDCSDFANGTVTDLDGEVIA